MGPPRHPTSSNSFTSGTSSSSSSSTGPSSNLAQFSRLALDPKEASSKGYGYMPEGYIHEEEEDAWALDSDDEDFALRQQRREAKTSTSAGKLTRPTGASSRSVSSSSFSSAGTSSATTARKHAPPARPHPFPLLATTSTSRSNTSPASIQQLPSSASSQQPTRANSTNNVTNNDRAPGSSSSSDWTIVAQPSSDAPDPQHPRSASSGPPLAGSPPADVGSTAAEAVFKASVRDQKPPPASNDMDRPSTPPSPVNAFGRTKDKEAQWYTAAIRPGVLEIVQDPFAILPSVAASLVEPPHTPGTDSTSSTPLPTPNTAYRQRKEHTQNLGRGFNDISSGATPLTSPPASGSPKSSFEPISMAGDGVTMSGSRWGNSTTSLQRQQQQQGSQQRASADRLAVPGDVEVDANGDGGLKRGKSVRTKRRWREFFRCLKCDVGEEGPDSYPSANTTSNSGVDLSKLRELSWNGIPMELRPIVWPLLLGYYTPANSTMRSATLSRKRKDYRKAVELAFGYDAFDVGRDHSYDRPQTPTSAVPKDATTGVKGLRDISRPHTPVAGKKRGSEEEKIWHQISIDVPRTNPGLPLWQRSSTQRALERLLYVWAIRHHATGYVQGMSDLATPFFQVFLSIYLNSHHPNGNLVKVEGYDIAHLPVEVRIAIEADTYWCLGKLLDGIQENYIFAQPGIQRQVRRMEELVGRIDAPLHAHLKSQQVEYIQFAFRWMNCLLMREMSVRNVTRLWDTYLAEGPDAFSDFHLYVCSVFLCKWSEKLREMDFQGCIMFLQSLPTQSWSDKDAELLLSEAFVFKNLFGQTKHLGD
ncbi:unnamed protein product [Sympodiomycopsis kandeliae]